MPNDAVLSAALAYAAKGWPVFPCGMDKKPLTKNGFYNATTDPEQIRNWWAKYPNAAIGVPTGRTSGILVIDLDVRPDGDGRESMRDLEARIGQLPDTVMSITPSGGNHRVFRYPGDDETNFSSAAGISDHVDVRADGGYIILPPSTIRSGAYTWELSSDPEDVQPAQLPDAWVNWLPHEPRFPENVDTTHFTLPKQIKPGERNDTLFRYAAQLRAKGADADQILAALQEANSQNCTMPLRDPELRAIAGSAMKYPAGSSTGPSSNARRQKPRLTMEILGQYLDTNHITLRYNIISRQYEANTAAAAGRDLNLEQLVTFLYDRLSDEYSGANFKILEAFVSYIADSCRYNPVLDYLRSIEWDHQSRIQALYQLLGLEPNDLVSCALVHLWLRQSVCLLFNSKENGKKPMGAAGCLVLNGPQGCGKTSLLRELALKPEWFLEGATVSDRDKDTTRRILSVWIAELGELETTLRGDIENLKNFVTAKDDQYRPPYARMDICSVRTTSLCASCNSDRFLIDQSGNRRWWVIPITKRIEYDDIVRFPWKQLWAEILAEVEPLSYEQKSACYVPSREIADALNQRNTEYEKPLKAEPEIRDILARAADDKHTFKFMTPTDFIQEWPPLKKYTAQQIGTALKKIGVESKRTNQNRQYLLPTFTPADTWVNGQNPWKMHA